MKRMIYVPGVDEIIPDGAVYYRLPVSNKNVVDVICWDDFTTNGQVLYDSLSAPLLGEPFIHHFAGWEVPGVPH